MQVSSKASAGTASSDSEVASNSPPASVFGRSAPVGEDWGRLMEQMPSVEEMRKEVADITCQMQSIYVADQQPAPCQTDNATGKDINGKDHVKMPVISRYGVDSRKPVDCKPFKSDTKAWPICLEGSTIKTVLGPCKVSSSAPRVEQVSEEFEINGKRYRQTYQKKVVLERRTTRDVFLLPASSGEPKLLPTPEASVEYASPYFQQASSTLDEEGTEESSFSKLSPQTETDKDSPRHEVTLVHSNPTDVTLSQKDCLTNVLVSSGVHRSPQHCARQLLQSEFRPDAGQAHVNRRLAPANGSHLSTEKLLKADQGKSTVRGMTDTIRKHMAINLRRTRSAGRSGLARLGKKKTQIELEMRDECLTPSHTTEGHQYVPVDGSAEPTKSSQAMAGYIYKFGVWDQKAPVLDPRLPLAVRTSVHSPASSGPATGAVVATPPEWLLAEMHLDGLANGKEQASVEAGPQHPMLRGRLVACLQRFTQQSEASGRPLHRSTYVQQTRLVRHRNKDSDCVPVEGIKFASDGHCGNIAQLLFTSPGNQLGVEGEEKSIENIKTTFQYCSDERLGLLQSICPAASAATSVLGRQSMKQKHATGSDSSGDESDLHTNGSNWRSKEMLGGGVGNLGQQKESPMVLVGATSWCPASLLVHDFSRYLVFTKDLLDEKRMKSRSTYELSIRGGTLDGLLLYALHLSSLEGSGDHLDVLFPHVFRITYPLFTTHETLVDKLIQLYVALSPKEPGCQRTHWFEALNTARFLVNIAQKLPAEEMSARLVLRLTRFAQLLILDGREEAESRAVHSAGQLPVPQNGGEHSVLANRLLANLPLLSAIAGRRQRGTNNNTDNSAQSNQQTHRTGTASKHSKQLASVEQLDADTRAMGELKWMSGDHFNAAVDRTRSLLKLSPESIALEITRIEEEYFNRIDFREFFDIRRLERGEARTLSQCVKHFNNLTAWARSQIFIFSPHTSEEVGNSGVDQLLNLNNRPTESQSARETKPTKPGSLKLIRLRKISRLNDMFAHLCEILKHLRILKNFSSLLAILLAVQEVSHFVLTKKSKALIAAFSNYMMPPKFTDYRRDLEAAAPPYLPYLGLVFQQLIHLHSGNSIFLPLPQGSHEQGGNQECDMPEVAVSNKGASTALGWVMTRNQTEKPESYINVWCCWKQYLILGYFIKRNENEGISHYNITCNKTVFEALNNFNDRVSDTDLNKEMQVLLSENKSKQTTCQ